MLSLVLYAFTRSPFDKVSFHAMDTLSSRDREQSKKMCLSQHVLDLILLKQHTDQNFAGLLVTRSSKRAPIHKITSALCMVILAS
jgi:hypothetical protein